MGRKMGGRFKREEIYICLWLIHVEVWQRIDWFDLLAVQGTLKSLLQHHNSKASILWHSAFFKVNSHIHTCAMLCLVALSCLTLCNSVDCSPPGSSVHGILQARILEWVARGSSCPREQTRSPVYVKNSSQNLLYKSKRRGEAIALFLNFVAFQQ